MTAGHESKERSAPRAPFLVFEGAEGVGKSTQLALLLDWLGELGVACSSAREPGGTAFGEAVRDLVLHQRAYDPSPEAELFLMLAARSEYVRRIVEPALARGEVFISDRFEHSTMAYQGFGRGLDLDAVWEANRLATGGLQPDLAFWLDLPADRAASRRAQASGELDRIETAGSEFFDAVVTGYAELARTLPNVERIDASRGPNEVHQEIRTLLRARFS